MGRDLPKTTEPRGRKREEARLHPLHSAGSSRESCGIGELLCYGSFVTCPGVLPQGALLRIL